MAILVCERKWTINASWISESIHNDALFDFMGSFGERRWNLKNNNKKKKISCTKGIMAMKTPWLLKSLTKKLYSYTNEVYLKVLVITSITTLL